MALAPLTALADDLEFEADLDPGQEVVVPVGSEGEGEAEFTVKRNRIKYKLEWEDLTSNAVAAHIHCAARGVEDRVCPTLEL